MGMLASPSSSAAPARIYHSNRQNSASRSSHIQVTGKLVEMYSHKRKSSRDPKSLQVSFLDREKYSREVRDFLELRADRAAQEEQAALSRLSEADRFTLIRHVSILGESLAPYGCGERALRETRMTTVHRTPHCTHACAKFSREHFMRDVWLNGKTILCAILSPPISLTRPSASSTPLTGIRRPFCPPPWGGMSGHLANPTPDTGYESMFCIDVSNEHTSISPIATGTSPTRTTPQSPPLRILIDLNIPELQAAASTQQQQAWFPPCRNLVHWEIASRKFWRIMILLTVKIASGRLVQTQMEKPLFSNLFRSESTVKRDQDQNVVQSLRDRKISIKSLQKLVV